MGRLKPMPPVGTPEHKAHCLGFLLAGCVFAVSALQMSKLIGAWSVLASIPIFIAVSARVYDWINRN
jgi:hypothetical protein